MLPVPLQQTESSQDSCGEITVNCTHTHTLCLMPAHTLAAALQPHSLTPQTSVRQHPRSQTFKHALESENMRNHIQADHSNNPGTPPHGPSDSPVNRG